MNGLFDFLYSGASDYLNRASGGTGQRMQGPIQPGSDPMGYASGKSQAEIDELLAQMTGKSGYGKTGMEQGMSAYRQAPDARTLVTPMDRLMSMATQRQPQQQDPIQMQGINPYVTGLFGG